MEQANPNRMAIDRLILTLIGAFAGAAFYALIEIVPDIIDNERLLLLLVTATGGFFAAFMASTGPLSFGRAALAALIAAIPAATLLYWASFRFDGIEDLLETGAPIVAYLVMVTIILPFLIALLLCVTHKLRKRAALVISMNCQMMLLSLTSSGRRTSFRVPLKQLMVIWPRSQ